MGTDAVEDVAQAPGSPRPTLLAVRGGRVEVIPGDPDGPRPVVEPGGHVKVWVNGALLQRSRLVEPTDTVVAEPDATEPRLSLAVRVSDDAMKAYLTVERSAGRRYQLVDAPPTLQLRVQARPVEEVPAPLPTAESVNKALEQAQVRFGVKAEAIEQAVTDPPPTPILVAEGQPPVPPRDGRFTICFEERQAPALDPEAERIDLFERGAVTWVEPGAVLARIEPPQEGVPGMDVRGRPVAVPRARPVTLKAGKGCRLTDDGTQIVATEPGRPHLSGQTLAVLPVYEVKGDAAVGAGHIRFAGDVHVRGDVLEGLEVQAGGEVRVGGLVSHARVTAGGSVSVGRTIISSKVEAGGHAAALNDVLPVLAPLSTQVQSLVEAARELRRQVAERAGEGDGSRSYPAGLPVSEGELLKRLIERKFWELPRLARRLAALGERIDTLRAGARRLAERTAQVLVGAGPLRVTLREMEEVAAELRQLMDLLEGFSTQEADIVAYSIQNAHLEASGRIVIRGSGAFNSTLLAGRGLDARRGVIRGGMVTVAEGDVLARELGGPTGVPTTVVVARRGKVLATLVYPRVTVSIGGQKHVFRDPARALRAYLDAEGKLCVEHFKVHPDAGPLADAPGSDERPASDAGAAR
ncbi:FapA family protein [Geochorda subterranea]|uniref:FapA family protein n=1 Tax=Geochorda subterranea TaxID=3109564 RepID=A0ABZ1BMD1_9FIRM|nr:FapA family protein [Limnochorda sp. LNt]WRP13974.1 FapA family protein [Limnochorda sp. LNt]